jgi:small-conductance mechanosensitive channel
MNPISQLIDHTNSVSTPWEALVLLGCLLLALGATKLLFKGSDPEFIKTSVWFGPRYFDGLMFPLLALILSFAAKEVWIQSQHEVILKVAVPVLLSVVIIRLMARVLSTVFPDSPGIVMLERFVAYLVWLVAALWITGFLPWVTQELETIHLNFGRTRLDLRTLIEGLLSSCLVLVLTLWVSSTLERQVLAKAVIDISIRKVATNVLRVFLTFIGLLIALSAVGVDLTALSVLGGGLGVGLGLGLQKLAANYVSGFVLLIERSIRIGDQVRVMGTEGRVSDIKTRYTLIQDAAGRECVVPNEMMISDKVENLSRALGRVLLNVTLSVDYTSPVPLVQEHLSLACAKVPRVLKTPAPQVLVSALGADGIELIVAFWIDPKDTAWASIKSEVNTQLLLALHEQGISVPTTKRVVRLVDASK